MKGKLSFIAILCFFVLSFFPVISHSSSKAENELISKTGYASRNQINKFTYTYVHVQDKNGVWWIYVYDGSELIDVYPE